MKVVTIAPIYVKQLLEGAALKGYNPEDILRAQGLPTQLLTNPKLRISTIEFAELCHTVTLLLRDEAFGLLTKPQKLGSFKFWAQASLIGDNIQESLKICRDSFNLIDNCISAYTSFTEDGGYIAFNYEQHKSIKSHYYIEALLISTHRTLCWLANEFLPIESVELAYPEPAHSEEHRFLFYGVPVTFNQKRNAIHFSKKTLLFVCHRNKADLNELLKNTHVRLLTQPKRSKSTSIRVRLWMENLFREGHSNPQIEQAAQYVGLTEQTLRRHLKKDDYSFQRLKDDTRRDMAISYITQKEHSIENIAFRLGFSEASTFIRAFKKWTGLTPLAYRKISQSNEIFTRKEKEPPKSAG